jgi:TfoX/Sxy family transcriptional regulator of competence genes
MPDPDRKISFAKSPPELVARFDEVMRWFPTVQRRSMFGYPCAFANEQMFTGLFAADWRVRLPDDARAELSAEGASPFEPMPGRPMKEYVVFPLAMIGDADRLTPWLERSLAYVVSLPPKQPKPPKAQKPSKR